MRECIHFCGELLTSLETGGITPCACKGSWWGGGVCPGQVFSSAGMLSGSDGDGRQGLKPSPSSSSFHAMKQ